MWSCLKQIIKTYIVNIQTKCAGFSKSKYYMKAWHSQLLAIRLKNKGFFTWVILKKRHATFWKSRKPRLEAITHSVMFKVKVWRINHSFTVQILFRMLSILSVHRCSLRTLKFLKIDASNIYCSTPWSHGSVEHLGLLGLWWIEKKIWPRIEIWLKTYLIWRYSVLFIVMCW